jgi:DNA-binding GntR family transcriptional regulator
MGQCEEHREIYDAVAAGDTDLAASKVLVHVTSGRDESIALAEGWSVVDPVAATRSGRR